MIEIDETTAGIWYIAFKAPRDVLAVLELMSPGKYRVRWRVKQYLSPEPFNDVDIVQWRVSSTNEYTEAEALHRVRKFIDALCAKDPIDGRWELLRGGRSLEELCQTLIEMPCAHVKHVSAEEYEALRPGDFKGALKE